MELTSLKRPTSASNREPASGRITIGKDVLELLSSAMYTNPLSLFREYVQNAADAIDEAFANNLLSESEGRIEIEINSDQREIVIRDNGIGICAENAEQVLTAFGGSKKRGGSARGFRGVGRFAALGYAQVLVFRTKASGDTAITSVRWDCRALKNILSDPKYAGDLARVVRDVVTIERQETADERDHFFEIRLEKVVRIRNDILLNRDSVGAYLGQVIPAPFKQDFAFGPAIEDALRAHIHPRRFRTLLNDVEVERPFSNQFSLTRAKNDVVQGVHFLRIGGSQDSPRAVGWVLEHNNLGALTAAPAQRGLRARVGDIQIGGEDIFHSAFSEPRFNSWVIGEIHVLDPKIVPTGRRDDFEQNAALFSLLGEMLPVCRELARQCRVSSMKRNRLKTFSMIEERALEILTLVKMKGLRPSVAKSMLYEVDESAEKMERIAELDLFQDMSLGALQERVETLRKRRDASDKSLNRVHKGAKLSASRRDAYEEVLRLVHHYSRSVSSTDALIQRIRTHVGLEQRSATNSAP